MSGGEAAGTTFQIGLVHIAHLIVITWEIVLTLALFSLAVTLCLRREPGPLQAVGEGALRVIDDTIRSAWPGHAEPIFPFITRLWIFILPANLIALIPGIQASTGDLLVTAAWFSLCHDGHCRNSGIR